MSTALEIKDSGSHLCHLILLEGHHTDATSYLSFGLFIFTIRKLDFALGMTLLSGSGTLKKEPLENDY